MQVNKPSISSKSWLLCLVVLLTQSTQVKASDILLEAQVMSVGISRLFDLADAKCKKISPELIPSIQRSRSSYRRNLEKDIEFGQFYLEQVKQSTGRDFYLSLDETIVRTIPEFGVNGITDQHAACNKIVRELEARAKWNLDNILQDSFSVELNRIESKQRFPCSMTGISTNSIAKDFLQAPLGVKDNLVFNSLFRYRVEQLFLLVDNCGKLQNDASQYRTQLNGEFTKEKELLTTILGVAIFNMPFDDKQRLQFELAIKEAKRFLQRED
jgi:hypothetical protein